MTWYEHAIWWHVYPLGFTGAGIRPGEGDWSPAPRLQKLEPWLDYVIDLGCNGLLLGPVFSSESHGYDTTDHFTIDPRLGTDADFDALIAACHSRGIKVALDGVFNHVGRGHPAFQTQGDLFRIDPATGAVGNFEGHDSLVALNHDSEAVADLVTDVMLHWCGRGVDAWRLDAAYAVPSSFWARVLPRVRAEFADVWILGEVIHGDYPVIVDESTMDAVTQYELWKATWSSLKDENFHELVWNLGRHNTFLDAFIPQTFVGNHDVTRIATLLPPEKAALAHLVLFTVGGIPSVYYGDEQGYTGTKTERIGGDDEVRPPFPDSPTQLSTLGASTHRLLQDLMAIRRRNPWLTTARTEIKEVSNTHLAYDAVGTAGERLSVELDLEPAVRGQIRAHGQQVYVVNP